MRAISKCGFAAVGVASLGLGTVQVGWWYLFGKRLNQFTQELDAHIWDQVRVIEALMKGDGEEAA